MNMLLILVVNCPGKPVEISINNKQIPINTTNFTMDNIFTASDIEVSC